MLKALDKITAICYNMVVKIKVIKFNKNQAVKERGRPEHKLLKISQTGDSLHKGKVACLFGKKVINI
ncbi:MAG: hypothetical protein PHY72_00120 [Candidatus Pacebacteria bacterium]|nr:hypothetical protein [Candidatus Paceibacterota bacterium]